LGEEDEADGIDHTAQHLLNALAVGLGQHHEAIMALPGRRPML
jgi:hypothetical protein